MLHFGPPDDRPHRFQMDAVGAGEFLLERPVAVSQDELGLSAQVDLLLLGCAGRADARRAPEK